MASDSPLVISPVIANSKAVQEVLAKSLQVKKRKPIDWGASFKSFVEAFEPEKNFTLGRILKEYEEKDLPEREKTYYKDTSEGRYKESEYLNVMHEFEKAVSSGVVKSGYSIADLVLLGTDGMFNTDFAEKLEKVYNENKIEEPETLVGKMISVVAEYAVPGKIATKILGRIRALPRFRKVMDKVSEVEEKLLPIPKTNIKIPFKKTPITIGGPGKLTSVARRTGYGMSLFGLTDFIGGSSAAYEPLNVLKVDALDLESTEGKTGRERAGANFRNRLRYGADGAQIGLGFKLVGPALKIAGKTGAFVGIKTGGKGLQVIDYAAKPLFKGIAAEPYLFPAIAKNVSGVAGFVGKDILARTAISLVDPSLLFKKIPDFDKWKFFSVMSDSPLQKRLKKLDNVLSNFKSSGSLSKSMSSLTTQAQREIRGQQKTIDMLKDDIDKTAYKLAQNFRGIYDDLPNNPRLYKQYMDFLEEYLIDQRELKTLPKEVQNSAKALKEKVEKITKEFKKYGFSGSDITKDAGKSFKDYYRLNFEVFTNPAFARKEGDEAFDNMVKFYEKTIQSDKSLIDLAQQVYKDLPVKEAIKRFASKKTRDLLKEAQTGTDPLKVLNRFAGNKWLKLSDEKSFVKTGEELPDVLRKFLGQEKDVRNSLLTTTLDLLSNVSMRRMYDQLGKQGLKERLLFKDSQEAFEIGGIPYENN